MNVYYFQQDSGRRVLDGGVLPVGERKPCSSCGRRDENYPPPEEYWKYVDLDQGSFVSSILWARYVTGVTEELKDALQKEGFEGIECAPEPIEIVEDNRPWKDRNKLPLKKIPPFYRVKLLTSIPIHQDFVDLYNMKTCPECGAIHSDWTPLKGEKILDGKHHPGTDFFGISYGGSRYGSHTLCTERGKDFLEAYPNTHCDFDELELRD